MDYKSKKDNNASYVKLTKSLKNGEVGKLYIFHGQEQYLLKNSIAKIRAMLCADGLDSFNYKRFDGNTITARLLEDSIETLPFMAERTLIEVFDYNLLKSAGAEQDNEREQICRQMFDLPDNVCIIFIYSTIEYKPDNRLKQNKEILSIAELVEFAPAEGSELIGWVRRHFNDAGKEISSADAAYLTEITGGLMTTLHGEIRKVAAYAKSKQITREDIDAVVVPVLDVQVYRLTDAIVRRDSKSAMQILDKLFQMREAPHKLIYSISLKMRQLLSARVCIESKKGRDELKKICDIYKDYPADILLNTAKKATLAYCVNTVKICAQTAKQLNNTSEPEAHIVELVAKLAISPSL